MKKAALLAALLVLRAAAEDAPEYRPRTRISGTLRAWGSAQMEDLLKLWETGFQRFHPAARFENHTYGAVSALGGLYAGGADFALNREIWPNEAMAFEQAVGHAPLIYEVATGSFDVPTKSDALGVFVSASNPLSQLSLAQLAAIFTSGSARTWGDLGLTGDWAPRPVHAYAYLYDNAGLRLFRDLVAGGSPRWNWDVKEFDNLTLTSGGRLDAGQRILDALAADPAGIAISNPHYASAEVKALAIGRSAAGPFVPLTRETVAARTYPLTRGVFFFAVKLDDRLTEFLRYILSREGSRDVVREGCYSPLPVALLRDQLARLR